MTRRLVLTWPSAAPFASRAGRSIRILAASDEADRALDYQANREALGPIDLVLGCGDLPPDRLAFLGDAFRAPLLYVRGNHDRGGPWLAPETVPPPTTGAVLGLLDGLPMAGLAWPGGIGATAMRDSGAAWRQVVGFLARAWATSGPWLVFSHAPPSGAGDDPSNPYHRGFPAYRFLLERLAPPLWLHGHTTRAGGPPWRIVRGKTTLLNVTGSVLIELRRPGSA